MNGLKYLPDFYIPSLDRWFEIKANIWVTVGQIVMNNKGKEASILGTTKFLRKNGAGD